jgi:Zn-dependent protease
LGVLTSLLLFASIITHGLAHSICAIRSNIPVKEITLFVFGGFFQITKEATHHRETRIATKVGQGIAYAFIAGGIAIILLHACCGLMACGSY